MRIRTVTDMRTGLTYEQLHRRGYPALRSVRLRTLAFYAYYLARRRA